ncbi:MAG: hypothetical protein ACHP7J_05420 [Terriglobales bacterium]
MNPLAWKKCSPRLVTALAAMAILLTAVGCGSSSNSGGGGQNQGFTNVSLNGQYAFTLRGVGTPDGINPFFFVEGGVFTADGNGNLTAITDDFIENLTPALNNQATGIYKINKDGSGDLQFNFANGFSPLYRITLSDDSHFYMEEDEGLNTSSGSGERQDTTKFASVPSGTFVLQTHDLLAGNSKVGVTTWTSGQIAGTGDVLSGGTLSSVTISGTAQPPGTTNGRGTVTITDDTGTSHYVYYVVNSTKLRFLNIDATSSLGIGRAEGQSGGPFSASSLNGSYVFGSAGETLNVDGIHSIGLFTTDGAGNVTAGSFDFVQDGNPVTGITLNSGTYTANASGRVDLTLKLSTGTTNEKVMFLVSPSRALFLVNDPTNVEDGTADKQSGVFSQGSLNGQAALFMDGFDEVNVLFKGRVGTLTPNGSGALSTNYRTSFFDANRVVGGRQDNAFSGTYAVSGNGRATAQFTNLTNNMLFYLSSTNTGYFLQADSGIDIGGAFTQQTGP